MGKFINIKTTANSIGLVLTIIGVLFIYINSPLNTDVIDGGDSKNFFVGKIDYEKNKNMTNGTYLVIIGSLFQLLSNYIQEEKILLIPWPAWHNFLDKISKNFKNIDKKKMLKYIGNAEKETELEKTQSDNQSDGKS